MEIIEQIYWIISLRKFSCLLTTKWFRNYPNVGRHYKWLRYVTPLQNSHYLPVLLFRMTRRFLMSEKWKPMRLLQYLHHMDRQSVKPLNRHRRKDLMKLWFQQKMSSRKNLHDTYNHTLLLRCNPLPRLWLPDTHGLQAELPRWVRLPWWQRWIFSFAFLYLVFLDLCLFVVKTTNA